ncbi:acetolactate synthase small subunit [Thermodesulfitimonas sp.]
MRHTLAVLVENNPGVLARVAGLFSRRGFNIESLAVGETENPAISRMTIVVAGDDRVLEQVTKQLRKLVEVIKVQDVTRMEYVDRELALIKVNAEPAKRAEIIQIVEIFRAHIVDIGRKTLVVEVTGDEGKINALVNALKPFGIREMVRTGKVAMLRGTKDIVTNGREAEA